MRLKFNASHRCTNALLLLLWRLTVGGLDVAVHVARRVDSLQRSKYALANAEGHAERHLLLFHLRTKQARGVLLVSGVYKAYNTLSLAGKKFGRERLDLADCHRVGRKKQADGRIAVTTAEQCHRADKVLGSVVRCRSDLQESGVLVLRVDRLMRQLQHPGCAAFNQQGPEERAARGGEDWVLVWPED